MWTTRINEFHGTDSKKASSYSRTSFHLACLERGVYLHYISPHHGYSSAPTVADIDETLNVMEDAIAQLS